MSKVLIILTGPPGSPLMEHAGTLNATVYDQRLGNKSMWRDHKRGTGDAVLVTPGPTPAAKLYWEAEANRYGFSPVVQLLDPGRQVCVDALTVGHGLTDAQKKRLARTVQRWYTNYSPHPREEHVNYGGNQSISKAKVG